MGDIFGIGAIAQGAASAYGATVQADAARDAANLQYKSTENALGFQKDMYNTQQKNAAPYLQAGQNALTQLTGAMGDLTKGFDPSTVQMDPGFDFRLQEGQKALERSAAARGSALGGAALKGLTRYAQDYSSNEYGNAYNRAFQNFETTQANRFNRLNSLVGTGLSANNQAGQAAQNYGNNAGQYAMAGGNALAAGAVGVGNAINSGISGMSNALNNYGVMNMLRGSGYSSGPGSGYVPGSDVSTANLLSGISQPGDVNAGIGYPMVIPG